MPKNFIRGRHEPIINKTILQTLQLYMFGQYSIGMNPSSDTSTYTSLYTFRSFHRNRQPAIGQPSSPACDPSDPTDCPRSSSQASSRGEAVVYRAESKSWPLEVWDPPLNTRLPTQVGVASGGGQSPLRKKPSAALLPRYNFVPKTLVDKAFSSQPVRECLLALEVSTYWKE